MLFPTVHAQVHWRICCLLYLKTIADVVSAGGDHVALIANVITNSSRCLCRSFVVVVVLQVENEGVLFAGVAKMRAVGTGSVPGVRGAVSAVVVHVIAVSNDDVFIGVYYGRGGCITAAVSSVLTLWQSIPIGEGTCAMFVSFDQKVPWHCGIPDLSCRLCRPGQHVLSSVH